MRDGARSPSTDRSDAQTAAIPSPLGPIQLTEQNGAIIRVRWPIESAAPQTPLLEEAAHQLAAYFAGERQTFDLPLTPTVTSFEARVLDVMRAIPFGETRTYGDIATALGTASQPVGRACGANPLPILIPCHRVVGASGLGGFSARGGVEDKVWLLRHEGAASLLL